MRCIPRGLSLLFFILSFSAFGAPVKKLSTEFASPTLIINGVTTSAGGRRFAVVQPLHPGQPEVVEITSGSPIAYPGGRWNGWRIGEDARSAFVGVNALRIGPDGALWIVDRGAPGIGKALVPGGPKLVRIDLASNKVTRIYDLGAVAQGESFVDDVRFNGAHAYLTDAGRPGLIVLDLATGAARRVLDNHPSTVASWPLMAEGRQLLDESGAPIVVHADQLEVSADGSWLYFQPCSGPMSRIETRYLDDASLEPSILASHVLPFADTASTGGTAIDADGAIYASDTNRSQILKVSPTGAISILISDPRLAWVDAMWIDDNGKLWMPAAQLNRVASLNRGKDTVRWPVNIYSMDIGAKPVRR